MFGDDRNDLLRSGLEEALACKDLLLPAPRRPGHLVRLVTEIRRLVVISLSRKPLRRLAERAEPPSVG